MDSAEAHGPSGDAEPTQADPPGRGAGASPPASSVGNPFRAILEVGSALVSSLDLDEVFANVTRKIGEAMMVSAVDIQFYDPERQLVTYVAGWTRVGLSEEDRAYVGTTVDVREYSDWRRIVEGHETVEWHIDDPNLSAEGRAEMAKWGYKTTVDAPLLVGDEVIGVLGLVESRFARRFTAIERDLFAQLCDLAAAAIHNARLFRRQREQTQRLDALVAASRAIASTVVLDEVLQTVCRTVTEAMDMPECLIYNYDRPADRLAPCIRSARIPRSCRSRAPSMSSIQVIAQRSSAAGSSSIRSRIRRCRPMCAPRWRRGARRPL